MPWRDRVFAAIAPSPGAARPGGDRRREPRAWGGGDGKREMAAAPQRGIRMDMSGKIGGWRGRGEAVLERRGFYGFIWFFPFFFDPGRRSVPVLERA
jgi:hypothetical protein